MFVACFLLRFFLLIFITALHCYSPHLPFFFYCSFSLCLSLHFTAIPLIFPFSFTVLSPYIYHCASLLFFSPSLFLLMFFLLIFFSLRFTAILLLFPFSLIANHSSYLNKIISTVFSCIYRMGQK